MILLLSLQMWPALPARAAREGDSVAQNKVKHGPIQETRGRTI
jgi:hypothetical protein